MVRFASLVAVVLIFANSSLAAGQDPTPPPAPTPTAIPTAIQPAPAPAPQPARPSTSVQVAPVPQPGKEQPPPRKNAREINVQIEITISDQIGGGVAEKKIVSMTVAEGTYGRVRASPDSEPVAVGSAVIGIVGTKLNVDARPWLLDGDRIRLELMVEYAPLQRSSQATQRPTRLNESMTVFLQNGKPMVISQAADPAVDRKVVLEARVTIAK